MSKLFYFTYGAEGHPFRGGWSEVIAENEEQAVKAFQAVHPDRNGRVNCAFIYGEERFINTPAYSNGNFGVKCHETIELKITKGDSNHDQTAR